MKEENKELKKGFFKKVWYSIDKIEKYSELSAEGLGKAMSYLFILTIMISIVSAIITTYKTSLEVKNIAQYINENSPEFSYNDGILKTETDNVIIDDKFEYAKIIVDTQTDSEEQINEYSKTSNENDSVIIILKDKVVLKDFGLKGTTSYNYKEVFEKAGINQFNKQELLDYLKSTNIMPLYGNLVFILFVYSFVIYLVNTLFYIITISIVGYISTLILKLKIRYVAVFNMAVYAITLPTILNMVYLLVNTFFNYTISYFDILYILVSSIYIIAALFILKSEFNKKQGEVQQIVEVEKQVKEEQEEKVENKEDNKKEEKTQKKEQSNDEGPEGEEPEGSNA